MYKVLNIDGDVVCVESIDTRIHRHLSGRVFNDNDACIKQESIESEGEVQEVEKQKRGRKKK